MILEEFASLEDLGAAISGDFVKVIHGSYMLELARELWPPGQAEPEGFLLVCQALRALAGVAPSPSLLRAYELQVLRSVGLAPSLDRCVVCGEDSGAAELIFSVEQGGILCPGCAGDRGACLPAEVHAGLLALAKRPLEEAAAFAPSPEAARGMRELMLRLVRNALGKEIHSLSFVEELRR
jgi:DNA repair protein RecO (recombination protein O)